MSRTASLACSVIRQAMDDIEVYLRALQRHRIRVDDIGTGKHYEVLALKSSDMNPMHRSAVCAAAFLSGADSHAEINKLWFDASGLNAKSARDKAESMYPIRQLLAMG